MPVTVNYNVTNNANDVDITDFKLTAVINRKLYNQNLEQVQNIENNIILKVDDKDGPDIPVVVEFDSINQSFLIQPKYGWLSNYTYYFNLKDIITVESDLIEAPITFTTKEQTTGTEIQSKNKISIYPNPANDFIIVESEGNGTINVINTSGKTILTNTIHKGTNQINIGDLSSGVFFVQVDTKEQKHSLKIIKE